MIRAVECRNPAWYRELAGRHLGAGTALQRRRSDPAATTAVRRREVCRVLDRLIKGQGSESVFVPMLIEYAERVLDGEHELLLP